MSFPKHVDPHVEQSPVLSDSLSNLRAHVRGTRWSWGSSICLNALGGFRFAHLVAA